MEHKTEKGRIITDAMLDEWEAQNLNGDLSGVKLGKTVIGRPPLFDEKTTQIAIRIPQSKLEALDIRATAVGKKRSELLRGLIDDELAKVM